jgi:hypothetical protein
LHEIEGDNEGQEELIGSNEKGKNKLRRQILDLPPLQDF